MSEPYSGSWSCDFARDDGTGGFLRLELRPDEGVAWYWAYLVGPLTGLVVVRDHEVPLPRAGLEIRTDGLWAELICETPGEHWSFGLEAFGLRLDDPAEALAVGGEIGERVAVGLDLEWEVDDGSGGGTAAGTVRGDLLVGQERIAFEGPGILGVADAPTDWWAAPWRRAWPGIDADLERPPSVIVPLGRGARLTRTLSADPLGWSERLDVATSLS
ncbi:MAG: hypothetical protein ACXW1S_00155 [Acidimicrobiia bacterium]